jgi:hypothetical protein
MRLLARKIGFHKLAPNMMFFSQRLLILLKIRKYRSNDRRIQRTDQRATHLA